MLHKDSGRLHSPKKVNRRKQKLNYQNRKEASALFMQYKDEYVSLLFKTESDYKELKKLTFTALSDQKSALDVNVGFDSQQQSLKTLKHHYSSARPLLKEADQKALDEFHFNLIRMVLGDIINKRGKSLSKQICTEMIKECVSQNKTSASGFLHDLQEMKKMLITGSNADGSVQVNADSMKDYLYIIDLISTLGKNNEDKLVRSHSTPVLSMKAQEQQPLELFTKSEQSLPTVEMSSGEEEGEHRDVSSSLESSVSSISASQELPSDSLRKVSLFQRHLAPVSTDETPSSPSKIRHHLSPIGSDTD